MRACEYSTIEIVGSRDKVVTLAVTGGIFVALGVWTNHWWTGGDGMLRVGLREAKICMPPLPCMPAPFTAEFGATGSFFKLANITYWVGLLGAALLFAHSYVISKMDEKRVGWAAGAACAATAALAIATVASKPMMLSMVGMSWSFPLTIIGAALGVGAAIPSLIPTGAVAKARATVAGAGDRAHRAVIGPIADLTDPKPQEIPEARVVDHAAPAEPDANADGPPLTAGYDDRLAYAAARGKSAAPRGGFMGRKERLGLGSPTREVTADTIKEALRFVAHRIELNDFGVHAYLRNGQQHQYAWSEISRAVMRHLPPDEPYRGLIMLDLLPTGASTPIRLLPTTHVNYGALPGGAGISSLENLKKLAVHVRDTNPAAVLDGDPPRFASPRDFLEYDATYG